MWIRKKKPSIHCSFGHPQEPDWLRCPFCKSQVESDDSEVFTPQDAERTVMVRSSKAVAAPILDDPEATRIIAPTQVSQELVGWLIALTGTMRGKDFRLSAGLTTLGLDRSCTIRLLDDSFASARHATVTLEEACFVIRDLASTNGTLVNSNTTDEYELRDGDRIRVGTTEFVFRCIDLSEMSWNR